ncbi:hypothetical protein ABK040_010995 [Willaertia magna]
MKNNNTFKTFPLREQPQPQRSSLMDNNNNIDSLVFNRERTSIDERREATLQPQHVNEVTTSFLKRVRKLLRNSKGNNSDSQPTRNNNDRNNNPDNDPNMPPIYRINSDA